jgi:hypothetical protein
MEAPPITPQTISYQLPRDVLIRVLFRRMLFRPNRIRKMALFLVAAILFYFASDQRDLHYVAFALFLVVLFLPLGLYRGIAKAIDQNSQFTDPKTVIFSPAGLVVAGPNYKSELAWTIFKGFSEDDTYFYLHLTESGFDSFVPKGAFTTEQQDEFRRYANSRSA